MRCGGSFGQILQVARKGLSGSIHDGFLFTLVALALLAALLMKNIRLEEQKPAVQTPERGAPDSPLAATLAGALEMDARSVEDRDLARFLRSADLSPSADPSSDKADALLGIAERIEGANGDYPALVSVAAGLADGRAGSERAVQASRTVIRPLADGRNDPAPRA